MDDGKDGEPEQTHSDARGRRGEGGTATIRNYAAGVVTAASPACIFSALILTSTLDESFTLILLFFTITAAGGALAGYLSAKRHLMSPLRMAVFSGIGSYGLLAVVDWMMQVNPIYDMGAIVGFPLGFAIGSRVVELRRASGK